MRKTALSLLALPLLGLALLGQDDCTEDPGDCPNCLADFAIYDPAYEDDGVWEEEVIALTSMMDAYGWTYEIVDHQDLNAGALGVGDSRRYRGLVAPGGYAYWRNRAVNASGEAALLSFVESGGHYVGFCAGTFWTADEVVWAEEATGGGGTYNQASDYATYPYDLGLLEGQAAGPLGWTPWEGGYGASLQVADIDTTNPTMAAIGIPAETRFFYYGGPVYRFNGAEPEGLEVWARALAPEGTSSAASTGDGEPFIIRFSRGEGNVILFSPHPEVLLGSDVDGITLTNPLAEADVEMDLGEQSLEEVNLHSWNIVLAALQIASGQPVTPITELP